MRGAAELRGLLDECLNELLGEDLGESADIEDVFLGIERLSWPPNPGSASMICAETPRMPA